MFFVEFMEHRKENDRIERRGLQESDHFAEFFTGHLTDNLGNIELLLFDLLPLSAGFGRSFSYVRTDVCRQLS